MTRLSVARVRAILGKELAEIARNRMALVPVLLLALFSIVLPFVIAVVIPQMLGEPLGRDPELVRMVERGRNPIARRLITNEAAVQAFVFQQFLVMQLLIPVTGAMAFAGYSLIGEKQGRTLEPLLATPVTTAELLVGKSLGALLPSLGIAILANVLYLTGIAFLAYPQVLRAIINARSALLVLVLGPVATLVALQLAVLVSSRVNDPRTAQQFGALLILPLTGLFVVQFNGALPLTVPIILSLIAALAVIWLVLVVVGVSLFDRETILTRWR